MRTYKTDNPPMEAMKLLLGKYLNELIEEDERVIVFDADLVNASGLDAVKKAHPEKLFDCGIQEANMVGMAAAASDAGAIPFTHTFGAFATRKCMDQIFLSACYPKRDIKMIGSDPGITAAVNGGSHQAHEDMGLLLGLNNITLVDITDGIMLRETLRMAKDTYGVFYMRLNRKETRQLYPEDERFSFGKGKILREGTDLTIIAAGIEVWEALKAAEILAQEGVEARVVDIFTWRPIDVELIVESAKKTGAIVTAENHVIAAGLGSAVARVVAENAPVPMGYIGVNERYGEVGSIEFLMDKFAMGARDIVQKARETLTKKQAFCGGK